jgi:hypothetical protein
LLRSKRRSSRSSSSRSSCSTSCKCSRIRSFSSSSSSSSRQQPQYGHTSKEVKNGNVPVVALSELSLLQDKLSSWKSRYSATTATAATSTASSPQLPISYSVMRPPLSLPQAPGTDPTIKVQPSINNSAQTVRDSFYPSDI